jgi:hypothetical protein
MHKKKKQPNEIGREQNKIKKKKVRSKQSNVSMCA